VSAPAVAFVAPASTASIFRHSRRDAWLVVVGAGYAALLAFVLRWAFLGGVLEMSIAALVVAAGVVWLSNTVAHVHLHSPMFRHRAENRVFGAYLSLLLAIPQTIWRARHLRHHTGNAGRESPRGTCLEVALIAALWSLLLWQAPRVFLGAYLPGYLLGLLLCRWQGDWEHHGGVEGGMSYYGTLYNRVWFNDGYHAEHHRWPGEHWTRLPARRLADSDSRSSAFPPLLRWIEAARWRARALARLERVALSSRLLQGWLVDVHERAFAALLPALLERGTVERIAVVGGGLFPRTVLVLRRLLPRAQLVVWEMNHQHAEIARAHLARMSPDHRVEFVERRFDGRVIARNEDPFDVVVLPLAFEGDRDAIRASGASLVVHDWLWKRSLSTKATAVVSPWLFKRLDLVSR